MGSVIGWWRGGVCQIRGVVSGGVVDVCVGGWGWQGLWLEVGGGSRNYGRCGGEDGEGVIAEEGVKEGVGPGGVVTGRYGRGKLVRGGMTGGG